MKKSRVPANRNKIVKWFLNGKVCSCVVKSTLNEQKTDTHKHTDIRKEDGRVRERKKNRAINVENVAIQ